MVLTRKRLPKPAFDVLEKAYLAGKASAHLCPVATPVDGGNSRDEWATRLCEAIMLATQVVPNRAGIAESQRQVLADYSYGLYGRMCPHGVGLDADSLSRFFEGEWGDPIKFTHLEGVPEGLETKTGVIFFLAERALGKNAHVDLWNGSKCLGVPFREGSEIYFWELHAASGGSSGQANGGGGSAAAELETIRAKFVPKPKKIEPEEERPPLRLEYEQKVRDLKQLIPIMQKDGFSNEDIAKKLHADRRALGVKYKDITPPEKREEIYERNIEKYGDKLGPSIEQLRQDGKSWVSIMNSACRPGGKDLKFGK